MLLKDFENQIGKNVKTLIAYPKKRKKKKAIKQEQPAGEAEKIMEKENSEKECK